MSALSEDRITELTSELDRTLAQAATYRYGRTDRALRCRETILALLVENAAMRERGNALAAAADRYASGGGGGHGNLEDLGDALDAWKAAKS